MLHPDKFAKAPDSLQDGSTILSAYASDAYSTLIDPILRSVYLLKLKTGVEALSEEEGAPQDLIMEVFAIREEIDECETVEELSPLHTDILTRFDDAIEEVGQKFEEEKLEEVSGVLKKAKYLETILV